MGQQVAILGAGSLAGEAYDHQLVYRDCLRPKSIDTRCIVAFSHLCLLHVGMRCHRQQHLPALHPWTQAPLT